jgi:hypothetical protein
MSDGVPLLGGWILQREFAVRSAGFPVSGLGVFGPDGESERLREVARDPVFREAVTWQNRPAVDNALDKVAAGAPTKPSRARGREEIVASYWQRYCGKTDTIGFFGPLAWGRLDDDGLALRGRSGALVRQRAVHLESWGVQALAETIDPELRVAAGPHSEGELRAALTARADHDGLAALDRLEAARDRVAAASAGQLRAALDALDATFVQLTRREPVRNPGRAYGARTLTYLDCMRDLDLDVAVGPALVAELAPALHALFEASRWYCGEVNTLGRRIIEAVVGDRGRQPFGSVAGPILGALLGSRPDVDERVVELQRRLATVLSDPEPATLGARAAAAFSDHDPGWRSSVFQSADIQIAAADEAAVCAGDFLAVIGDVHPGNNPLIQGVFAHRHPNPDGFVRTFESIVGPGITALLPPWGPGLGVDARGLPLLPPSAIQIALHPDVRAPAPARTWHADELVLDGGDVVDRSGELRIPLLDVFGVPIFVSGVRAFELLPDEEHTPRVTVGHTVLQREGWSVPAADLPRHAQDLTAFARDVGMPRQVFAKSPLERKPMYLNTQSPVLGRILCRHARQAAAQSPRARIRFSEMLPTPDQTWLADHQGNRYVSELRIVGVDAHRAALKIATPA